MASPALRRLQLALSHADRHTGRSLDGGEVAKISAYYQLVLKWNQALHLTTIVDPEEFAKRHIFESMIGARAMLDSVTKVWDIGSGLGVPGVPMAILKPDLSVVLVESNLKKAVFLKELIHELSLSNVEVINSRFEDLEVAPATSCLASRAIEKMGKLVVKIIAKTKGVEQYLFFVGSELGAEIQRRAFQDYRVSIIPLPLSDRQVLISLIRST